MVALYTCLHAPLQCRCDGLALEPPPPPSLSPLTDKSAKLLTEFNSFYKKTTGKLLRMDDWKKLENAVKESASWSLPNSAFAGLDLESLPEIPLQIYGIKQGTHREDILHALSDLGTPYQGNKGVRSEAREQAFSQGSKGDKRPIAFRERGHREGRTGQEDQELGELERMNTLELQRARG